eukprot:CAMPEP_0113418136 /NCGR_PEP_ID=MMETSP0013_2-20120614/26042_1 /TAXON_ID=2843 ORGANISM="Skeletonema costatum, Strain 1716" /NCGR_SAMPLE_ID=MMETSP0013_2 /ASSEMBLY_ACC=CAM_ASM_000158 /LENGTH=768 /DNA_ID=CAMNT_0000305345 /DNA_START=44 /DNA_END=2350 /DNA_ORIENTATION=+ /assembly_acc=CAM_ASM_000158
MSRQQSLAVSAAAALLFLLSASSTQAFQPASSLSSHHHHHPLASAVAGNEETVQIVTSPITGSETNIKYPTQRGSEVDSRKIINYNTNNDDENNNASPLLALRLSHILFASKELATQTLDKLTAAEWNFEQMATSVSNCAETREEGGSVGWLNLSENFNDTTNIISNDDNEEKNPNEHLDLILPPSARQYIIDTPSKPGDILMMESNRGVHLVQVVDVMVDVRKLSYIKARNTKKKKKKQQQQLMEGEGTGVKVYSNDMELGEQKVGGTSRQGTKLAGIMGGALLEQSEEEVAKLGLTYKIETMGCQMNSADSERIEGQLMSLGIRPLIDDERNNSDEEEVTTTTTENNGGLFQETKTNRKSKKKKPDIIILNTCSIRDHAEQKVYSYLGPHAKRKRDGEDVTIVVAGCVAQQEGQSLLRRVPEIDLVMGPQYANRIGDLLEDVANGNQVVATEASHIMEDSTKPRRQSSVCAWVNVIYGCNERCTYCIVPTTRGVEQSRPVESIVDEVSELVNQGFKEVTLLGQNIDAYGRDMIPKRKFSDLLKIVGSVPGLERLRFVTSHPRYMSLGVVDAVADTPTACEYFHIPFQSGSNSILKAMGRGHTREKFLQIVDRVRQRLPDAAITADVIVGFPGETEQDFLDTLDIMEKVKFDTVNTAAYSPRPNTPAADWDNQLSEEVKQDRLHRINELVLQHATERRARMMDRVVEVLVEERNVKVPTQVMGRTTHGYIVYFDGDIDELRGELVNVKIDRCEKFYLAGKRTDEPVQ